MCVRQVERLTEVLRAEGLTVQPYGGALLSVTGADRARVGEIAFQGGVPIHELAQRDVSVADAFCTVTAQARAFAAEQAAKALRDETAAAPPRGRRSRRTARQRKYADRYGAASGDTAYLHVGSFDANPAADLAIAAPIGSVDQVSYGADEKSRNRSLHRRPRNRRWRSRTPAGVVEQQDRTDPQATPTRFSDGANA